jgi:pimeloyl-ACP methyl ester carboxylesterase
MKKLPMVIPLVILLCFTFCCQQVEEVAAEKETEPTIKVDKAISSDGVSIAFEVRGKCEPALVFVHGWASKRSDWDSQMDYFSDNHKVVAVDLASFGESGSERENWTISAFGDDVVSVVKQLDLNEAILVGHSMGTTVILETAIKIPEKIIGLVPVDMLQNLEDLKRTEEEINKRTSAWMNWLNFPTEENVRRGFGEKVEKKIIVDYLDYYAQSSKRGWEDSLRATFSWLSYDLITVLKEIKAPICCINSDRRATDVGLARKYAPSFNAKIVEGVGHSVQLEAPDEFNRLLEESIQEFIQISEQK